MESPYDNDQIKTASIIERAFPRKRMFATPDPGLEITELHSALFRARKYSGYGTLGECIAWARMVTDETRPTLREKLLHKVNTALDESENKG